MRKMIIIFSLICFFSAGNVFAWPGIPPRPARQEFQRANHPHSQMIQIEKRFSIPWCKDSDNSITYALKYWSAVYKEAVKVSKNFIGLDVPILEEEVAFSVMQGGAVSTNGNEIYSDTCKGNILREQVCARNSAHEQVEIACPEAVPGTQCMYNEEMQAYCGYTDPCPKAVGLEAGTSHTCLLAENGTVWCWGWNMWGQLGDGTTETKPLTPVQVVALDNVTKISAGGVHNCAIKTDGSLWCWGRNGYGALGIGNNEPQNDGPVEVSTLTDVVDVSAGSAFTCAVAGPDRSVWCWGDNHSGQLGTGDTEWRLLPTQIENLSDVASVEAGDFHACVVKNDDTVWCWGSNKLSQIGDETNNTYIENNNPNYASSLVKLIPTQVSGLSNVKSLAAAQQHTCALKNDNTVWCFGANFNGQIGVGLSIQDQWAIPVKVEELSDIYQFDAHSRHTCSVRSDGTVWCWGESGPPEEVGSLKYIQSDFLPTQVEGLKVTIERVAVGQYHACGLDEDTGRVWCWGGKEDADTCDGTYNFKFSIDKPIECPEPQSDLSWENML